MSNNKSINLNYILDNSGVFVTLDDENNTTVFFEKSSETYGKITTAIKENDWLYVRGLVEIYKREKNIGLDNKSIKIINGQVLVGNKTINAVLKDILLRGDNIEKLEDFISHFDDKVNFKEDNLDGGSFKNEAISQNKIKQVFASEDANKAEITELDTVTYASIDSELELLAKNFKEKNNR